MELTKEQKKHLKSIQWLLSGPRACGKTFLLAIAIIEQCKNQEGIKFRILNHNNNHNGIKEMAMIVTDIICDMKLSNHFRYYAHDHSLLYSYNINVRK